jgi:hypothetical protein
VSRARKLAEIDLDTFTRYVESDPSRARTAGNSQATGAARARLDPHRERDSRGGARFDNPVVKSGEVLDAGVVDAEVVDAPASRRQREPRLEDWLLDMLPAPPSNDASASAPRIVNGWRS